MYFRYSQINVGGRYLGPQIVIVEAETQSEAEARAVEAGVYFDGVAAERDCVCCGDRWTRYPDEFGTRAEALASIEQDRTAEEDAPVFVLVDRTGEVARSG